MSMELHRNEPPPVDLPPMLDIGSGIRLRVEPRAIMGSATVPDLFKAMDRAGARLWGFAWKEPFESLFGLGKGRVNNWMSRQVIPPPRLVAWLAWAGAQDNPRALGIAILTALECERQGAAVEHVTRAAQVAIEEARR